MGALALGAAGGCASPDPTRCANGQVLCDGRCVDPARDPRFCGATGECNTPQTRGRECGAFSACSAGVCRFSQPPTSYISMGGTDVAGAFPESMQFVIASPIPATIYYTVDRSTPMPGMAGTLMGRAPVLTVGLPATGAVRWYADYGPPIGRELDTHSYEVTINTEATSPSRLAAGVLASDVTINGEARQHVVVVAPGARVRVEMNYRAWQAAPRPADAGAPPTLRLIAAIDGTAPGQCESLAFTGGVYPGRPGMIDFESTAPTNPGRYALHVGFLVNDFCPSEPRDRYPGPEVGQIIVR